MRVDDGGAEPDGFCLSVSCPSRFPQSVKLRGLAGHRSMQNRKYRLHADIAISPQEKRFKGLKFFGRGIIGGVFYQRTKTFFGNSVRTTLCYTEEGYYVIRGFGFPGRKSSERRRRSEQRRHQAGNRYPGLQGLDQADMGLINPRVGTQRGRLTKDCSQSTTLVSRFASRSMPYLVIWSGLEGGLVGRTDASSCPLMIT